MICHRLAKQGAVRRLHEVRNFPPLQLIRSQTDKVCGTVVRKQYTFIMNEYYLGQGLRKFGEKFVPVLNLFVTFANCIEQAIDRFREFTDVALV